MKINPYATKIAITLRGSLKIHCQFFLSIAREYNASWDDY